MKRTCAYAGVEAVSDITNCDMSVCKSSKGHGNVYEGCIMTYHARNVLQSLPHKFKHASLAGLRRAEALQHRGSAVAPPDHMPARLAPSLQVVQRRLMDWHWHAFPVCQAAADLIHVTLNVQKCSIHNPRGDPQLPT